MLIPLALALGGVGFPSMLLALRGRVVLGLGGGRACVDSVAASSAACNAAATSGAGLGTRCTSGALAGLLGVSTATAGDGSTSGAACASRTLECEP
jgi:hypothetical protein